MPRQTIKSLEKQIITLRELRDGDKQVHEADIAHQQWQTKEITSLRTIVEQKNVEITELKRSIQWHKQLLQNLSEAICAHMRNR